MSSEAPIPTYCYCYHFIDPPSPHLLTHSHANKKRVMSHVTCQLPDLLVTYSNNVFVFVFVLHAVRTADAEI